MAKEVNDTIVKILETHGSIPTMEAIQTVSQWMSEKRYVRDIWA